MKKPAKSVLVSLDQHIASQIDTTKPASHTRPAVTKADSVIDPKVVVAPKQVPFRIIEDVRPTAGGRLFAFTQAWLEVSGMADGKAYDRTQARKVAGDTAISYHTKLGNFEATSEGMKLTVKGSNFFKARQLDNKVDPKMVDGYKAIFTTGKMDGELVKAHQFIVAM